MTKQCLETDARFAMLKYGEKRRLSAVQPCKLDHVRLAGSFDALTIRAEA